MSEFLLQARELTKDFPVSGNRRVHAVSGVSLEIRDGETLGLVGESGCGKSTLGRLLLRLIHPTSGEVLFRGQSITGMSEKAFHPLRRQMQLVFQDPYASLDPRMSVRDLIAEPIINWRLCDGREAVTQKVVELLEAVGLQEEFLYRYPHQFSGGQRQRIGIARAIAVDPAFIVCDEPVSALDVSVQNQILNLLKALKSSRGLTYLFIS
ncbi:MAG: dipeptide/oligopeptide/nickel ABC transporter ATP-binding protein, partial [Eubacteriales bacterium]